MRLANGTRLGPYEIVAPLATGGMGDVYRALDTRLDRIVAVKLIQDRFSSRFEREARAVAALNHPNICQIYDVGPNYLVMEYVEGEPVLPTDDQTRLLGLALQISDALVAAHEAGVIHRDLKPANILVTSAGQVKVLDFGLASLRSGTVTGRANDAFLTEVGTILGTDAYMPPEQVRGESADARSDLWSLGVVLYELASGSLPFAGTRAEIFEAVLSRPAAPVRSLNPLVSAGLARIIGRLLEKNPAARYQTAADVRAELRRVELSGATKVEAEPSASGRRRNRLAYGMSIAALAFAAFGAAGFLLWEPAPKLAPVSEWQQLTAFADSVTEPALSGDGRMVAFIHGGRGFPRRSGAEIYLKLLPNGEPVQLTESANAKCCPTFSPDGSRVAFTNVTAGSDSWDTLTVSVLGGATERMLSNAAGLAWIGEHDVLFSEIKGDGLHMGVVTATENRSDLREIYFPDHEREMVHYSHLSPDRRWVLMVEMGQTGGFTQACRVIPFDGSGAAREIGPPGGCSSAAWSPDGKWMYFSARLDGERHLWRQRFPDGKPEQITFGPTEQVGIAAAPDGRSLITTVGQERSHLWVRDASGERQLSREGTVYAPQVSAAGSHVYYMWRQTAAAERILRVMDVATGSVERLLPGIALVDFDVSPDEREVVFTTLGDTPAERTIWLASLDLRDAPRAIASGADQVMFAADDWLVYRGLGATDNFLFRVKKDGTGAEQISDFGVVNLFDVSPDGAWASVVSSGSTEGYAVPLDGGQPIRLCANLNCNSEWSSLGERFYLRFPSGQMGAQRQGRNTIVFAVTAGRMLPQLPPEGLSAENINATVAALGASVIEEDQLMAGPDPTVQVFLREATEFNLFRIPFE